MGVPALFSLIARKYAKVLKIFDGSNLKVDNLYFDSNSIIYDYVYANPIGDGQDSLSYETEVIEGVCEKLKEYVRVIQPSKTVYIAFDGVAPVAKLEQQRQRRYKSSFTKRLEEKAGVSKVGWDTTAITPGTGFMSRLDLRLKTFFSSARQLKVKSLVISSGMEHGEGEHKIYEYIRSNPKKHEAENTVIYGLDADLIMLSLNHLHCCPNLYLFRETPHFARSLNTSLEPNALYVLDISYLFDRLCLEMNDGKPAEGMTQRNRAYDYILMCFLLGNDFIPHNPAINLRSKGMEYLMNAYRSVISGHGLNLTDGRKIIWKNFRKFIQFLADREHSYFIKEHSVRDNLEKRPLQIRTDESELIQKLNAIPIYNREKEKYINPRDNRWQERYYQTLFDKQEPQEIQSICLEYLRTIEWTLKYYTSGCPDWRHCYDYNYAPLLEDVVKAIPVFDTELIEQNDNMPVRALTQLSYVLPSSSHYLLPDALRYGLQKECGDYYGDDWEFEWSYCKYFWECHAKMPMIDLQKIEVIEQKYGKKSLKHKSSVDH
jgi:5'-3' exonuclease